MVGKGVKTFCCCSVAKPCPTFSDPMNCSTPRFPVLHCLPEFAQSQILCVDDAIQPSHPLLVPSPDLNLSQLRVFPMSLLFASGGQSPGVSASATVLPMNIQVWFPLRLTGLISFLSKRLSRVFSSTTVQKYQFFGTQPSLPISYIHTWLLKNQSFDYMDLCQQSDFCFLMCHLGLS